jgi:signal transduction histidine kinase
MKHFRSVWAVLAGYLLVIVLSVTTDILFMGIGLFPGPNVRFATWMLALALIYTLLYSFLGGYITAKLAPARKMLHVSILGALGVLSSLIGAIAGWEMGDHWYPIALVILAFPSVYLGGKLKKDR